MERKKILCTQQRSEKWEGNVLNRKGSGGRLFYPKNISRAPPHKYEGGTIMSFVKLRLQYHTATSIPHRYLMGSMWYLLAWTRLPKNSSSYNSHSSAAGYLRPYFSSPSNNHNTQVSLIKHNNVCLSWYN